MSIIASAILATAIPATTNLAEQVSIMWTAHTNRIAMTEARKTEATKRKAAVEQVRENAKKHKSRMGRSSGGVK